MSDLICRKTMMRCSTPGMCAPFGGCHSGVLVKNDVRYAADAQYEPAAMSAVTAEAKRLQAECLALLSERDQLRAAVERLQRELATAHADASHYASSAEDMRAEVERLRQSLRSVIVAAGGSAAPDVSAELLELAPLEVLALRGNLDQLQARLRSIEQVAACGSVQSWLALPDDARAQWFAMHLEMDDERRALRQDAVRIEWLASQARMIYGRKGEASYQLEELSELIHSGREECRPDDLRRAIDEAMERAK